MAETKEIKEKSITITSIYATMQELEELYGVTEQQIYQNWYELKRRLVAAELQEETPKELGN